MLQNFIAQEKPSTTCVVYSPQLDSFYIPRFRCHVSARQIEHLDHELNNGWDLTRAAVGGREQLTRTVEQEIRYEAVSDTKACPFSLAYGDLDTVDKLTL